MSVNNDNKNIFTVDYSDVGIIISVILIIVGLVTAVFIIGFFIIIAGLIYLIINLIYYNCKRLEITDSYIKVYSVLSNSKTIPRSEILSSKYDEKFIDKIMNSGIFYIKTEHEWIKFGRVSKPRYLSSLINNYISNPDFSLPADKQNKNTHIQNNQSQQKTNQAKPAIINSNNYQNLKGEIGEEKILKILESKEISGYRKILRNIYVPQNNPEDKSEIDIVMIHEKGIYVFESKNMSGNIYGRQFEQNWHQYFYNDEKYTFNNPIKQNRTHILNLKSYLNIKSAPYFSYIVFGTECELRKLPEETYEFKILSRDSLSYVLNEHINELENIFTPNEIDEIYNKLQPLANVSEYEKMKHIIRLNKKYDN